MEDKNHVDFVVDDEGFMFVYPSRLLWQELSDSFSMSDHLIFLQKDEDRLEKFIFRKLR